MMINTMMNINVKNKFLLFINSELFIIDFFIPIFLTPKGVPHEVQNNLPDSARSALKLVLPQTKHLFFII